MAKRKRMLTDEVLCSTKFLNMHKETQLLYVFLMLHCDDDGIVDPFPVMRMTSITNLATLEELICKEFLYEVDLNDNIYYIVHFHAQNKIPPSKKTDSMYLPKLIAKHPELIGTIVVDKKDNSYSQNLTEIRKMEAVSKILPKRAPKWAPNINKEINKEINNIAKNRQYIGAPEEVKQKMAEWKRKL